jgi:outer membrane immunogenic protein
MKRIALLTAAAVGVVGLAHNAMAADLGVRPAPQVVAPAPIAPTWTGFYLGFNGGWGWTSSNNVTVTPTGAIAGAFPAFSISQQADGPVFGGQAGYNYQVGSWVFGIEGDVDGFGSQKGFKSVFEPTTGAFFSASATPQWLATVRGRLGYTWGPGMIYITGGGAWSGVHYDVNDGGFTNGTFNNTRSGWTLGAGYEWMIAPNWMVRAEYLYYGFNNSVNNSAAVPAVFGGGAIAHNWDKMNTSVARLGLNYKFDWWR